MADPFQDMQLLKNSALTVFWQVGGGAHSALVGFSGSERSRVAVRTAYECTNELGMKLVVAHVICLDSMVRTAGDQPANLGGLALEADDLAERYRAQVAQSLGEEVEAGWTFVLLRGFTARELAKCATEVDAGAIILGESRRLLRLTHWSVHQQLSRILGGGWR